MAKKRKNPFDNPESTPGANAPGPIDIARALHGIDMNELLPLVEDMTEEEGMSAFAMISYLAEIGVKPETYTAFYNVYQRVRPMMTEDSNYNEKKSATKRNLSEKSAMSDKTLRIRIQMKGVVKPPMWREVEIPSDASFLLLHKVIQTVVGLQDYHLWQFSERAYDGDILIGLPIEDDFGMGIEDITDDAYSTPISAFLAKEGDKLEYVYDFGDDWIFVVSVKKVLDRKLDHPVCVAFKSDLNPEEDSGGILCYLGMRSDYAEWKSYTKKKRKEIAERMNFDSADDYYENLRELLFDIDEVNEALKEL